jgi:hypothetical protein
VSPSSGNLFVGSPLTVAVSVDALPTPGNYSDCGVRIQSNSFPQVYQDAVFSYAVGSVVINGACGTANGKTYANGSASYGSDTQCATGNSTNTAFPSAGNSTTWVCNSPNGGTNSSTCSASQAAAVPATGIIEGYKLKVGGAWPPTEIPPTTETVSVSGGPSTSVNPFVFTMNAGNSYVLNTTVPSGWSVSHTLLIDGVTTQSSVAGASMTIALPSGAGHIADVYWNFSALVPTVNISVAPLSISSGGQTNVSWSSSNASSCTASNGWSGWPGSKATSGSQTISGITTTVTFTLTCVGPGGSTTGSATVTVTANPAPTVAVTVTPPSVTSGGSSTVTWSTTNATACTASGGWSGAKATSGSQTITNITTTSTYTLTCTGSGGSASDSGTVTVAGISTGIIEGYKLLVGGAWPPTEVPPTTETVSVSGGGSTSDNPFAFTVNAGSSYTVSATVPSGWSVSHTLTLDGTLTQSNVSGASMTIAMPAGVGHIADVLWNYNAPVPTVLVTASPTTITSGGSSTVTWSTTNATACTASGGWSGAKATSGSQTITNITTTSTYTISCTGPGGSGSGSDTVTVTAALIPGACGTASSKTYPNGASSYGADTQCSAGSSSNSAFPASGASVSWVCHSPNGGADSGTCSASQAAPACVAPTTGTITLVPSTISPGGSYELRCDYGSANDYIPPPAGCTWPGSGGGHIGSAVTFACTAPNTAGTYTETCQAQNGGPSGSTNFCSIPTAVSTPLTVAATPTVVMTPSPASVTTGGSATITWSTTGTINSNVCQASGGWSGNKTSGTNQSETLTNLTNTASYALTCTGPGGTGSYSTTITVTIPNFTLQVNKSVGGSVVSDDASINCGSACSQIYPKGTAVTLTATADNPTYWKFVGWTGACAGQGTTGTCTVTVNSDTTTSALFAPRPFQYQEF